jgi:putative intracellular protease/amidase
MPVTASSMFVIIRLVIGLLGFNEKRALVPDPSPWRKTPRRHGGGCAYYDTVFYPGGHGPMWDIAEDENLIKLIESFLAAGKPVALVCHAPGALRHVKTPQRASRSPRART